MPSAIGLDEIDHLPAEERLHHLMWAHRFLKKEIGPLSEHKLRYIEQGNLDVWQFEHDHLQAALVEVEQAIERICPLPTLADLT